MDEAPTAQSSSGALDELSREELMTLVTELQKANSKKEEKRRKIVERTGKLTVWLFTGPSLYNATKTAWEKWCDWLEAEGEKQPIWPKEESGQFVAALLSRVMKIGLLSLLAVIAFPIMHAVFLMQQNRLFDRQNQFIAFEQTTKFRELLFQLPLDTLNNEIAEYVYSQEDVVKWPPPNYAVIEQIIHLGQKEPELIIAALQPLLHDNNSSVSAGALLTLYAVDSTLLFDGKYLKAYLYNAQLSGANLWGADFWRAKLDGANLVDANLVSANLREATLWGANLSGADLWGAYLRGANFRDVNLEDVSGLTIHSLCEAGNLWRIKPDSLLSEVEKTCPDKLIRPE